MKNNTFVSILNNKSETLNYWVKILLQIICILKAALLLAQTGTVTDIEGNTYKTVTIGTQLWMAENLKTTKYNDGTVIPIVTDSLIWTNYTSDAYCNFKNDINNVNYCGRLYNWYVVKTNKVCPQNWHVPSTSDWDSLIIYLANNGYNYGIADKDIGKSLASITGWTVSTINGNIGYQQENNNKSGFNAFPVGARLYGGIYSYLGYGSLWWSSSESTEDINYAYSKYLFSNGNILGFSANVKYDGLSIRCVKDLKTPLNTTLTADKKSICSNDSIILNTSVDGGFPPYSYTWESVNVNSSKIMVFPKKDLKYYVTVTDAEGTSKVDSISIKVIQPTSSTTTASICQGSSYSFNGNAYSTTGTYTAHLTNAAGCDSIAMLILTTKSTSTNTITKTACNNYMLNGQTYTQSGTYTQTLVNANGCDSIITLHLTINSPSTSTTKASICDGKSYIFNGKTYSIAGTYTTTLLNSVGCDSIATLILSTNTTSTNTITKTADNYYTLNGQTYTQSGTYTQMLTSAGGCDSVITLYLTITQKDTVHIDTLICEGEIFNYKGKSYITAGKYIIPTGMSDTIISLHLGVMARPKIKLSSDTVLCSGTSITVDVSLPGTYNYLWQDKSNKPTYTFTKGGIYSISIIDTNNCKTSKTITVKELSSPQISLPNDTSICDIINIAIHLNCEGCTYLWQDGSVSNDYSIQNDGLYWVTAKNYCGISRDSILVDAKNCTSYLDVPSAFSPNSDGLNDVLYAVGRNVDHIVFVIFNRWGQKVFESHTLSDGWDGFYKGRLQEAATFMYSISATATTDGKKIEKKGTITLVR